MGDQWASAWPGQAVWAGAGTFHVEPRGFVDHPTSDVSRGTWGGCLNDLRRKSPE